VAYFILVRDGPVDFNAAKEVVGGGLTISLSVIMGLPAVLAALWLAIRISRTPFTEYLALRWTSWSNLAIGVAALVVVVTGWDLLSRAAGRDATPGFMMDVLKSAQADGALWLLVIAFCVPAGAVLLSSLVWTALHLQYDWFFFGEVFSIGLLLGYLRYRSNSILLTMVLHGLNNLAATLQTMWLAGHQ